MKEAAKLIDARGLACPEPVMLAKRAIEGGLSGDLDVLVDSEAARDNVLRFARHAGREAEALAGPGGDYRVRVRGS